MSRALSLEKHRKHLSWLVTLFGYYTGQASQKNPNKNSHPDKATTLATTTPRFRARDKKKEKYEAPEMASEERV